MTDIDMKKNRLVISSKSNSKIKEIKNIRKHRGNFFIIEGLRAVKQAIDNNLEILDIYTIEEYSSEFRNSIIIDKSLVNYFSSTENSQGIFAIVKKKAQDFSDPDKIVLCDKISDPGNLGAILRASLAFGFDGVYTTKSSVDFYNDKVVRSSLSSINSLMIKSDIDIDYLKKLKQTHKIYGSFLKDSISHRKVQYPKKMVLVIGSEARGISREIEEIVDTRITINIKNTMESLNASQACAILLEEISNKDNQV